MSELRVSHARAPVPAQVACDACGYERIEFRPLERCPMCGVVAAELRHEPATETAAAA